MEFIGEIRATPDGKPIDRRRWIEMIGTHPNIAQPRAREITNPFTKRPTLVKPREDAARVVLDEKEVGSMSWAEDDSGSINVFGERDDVVPLARDLAELLGGRFEEIVS